MWWKPGWIPVFWTYSENILLFRTRQGEKWIQLSCDEDEDITWSVTMSTYEWFHKTYLVTSENSINTIFPCSDFSCCIWSGFFFRYAGQGITPKIIENACSLKRKIHSRAGLLKASLDHHLFDVREDLILNDFKWIRREDILEMMRISKKVIRANESIQSICKSPRIWQGF